MQAKYVVRAVLLAASAAAPIAQGDPAPRIPLCDGMTLVTAVNGGSGDYESIKTIKSVSATEARISYSAEKMDYGDLFSTDPPRLRSYVSKRIQRLEDIKTSRQYLQQFDTIIPEDVPGMTSLGTSSLVLSELKNQGHADFSFATFWGFVVPPSLNRDDPTSVYRTQLAGQAKVVSSTPEQISVLVNGVPTSLPAIHVGGNFIGYVSEFWFLDQPDNPLTLRYRIGVNEIKPKTPEERKDCESQTRMIGYVPQHCLKLDGGDQSNLDLVKINFTCAVAPPPGGQGGGAGAGAGAGMPSGVAKLEESLIKEGRAEIPDIFFRSGSNEIREESESSLLIIAEVLKRHPDWKLSVEGHTDSLLADDFNQKLSERRAAAVKQALVTRHGIVATRLTTQGFGESKPRAANDTLAGRARNRRVELVRVP
ncbi:MAG TPA: OmpA family protein [Steroidobacteraceae bacterium]|nr:OmpA family protein [Steroidobacteraceae bacterium]